LRSQREREGGGEFGVFCYSDIEGVVTLKTVHSKRCCFFAFFLLLLLLLLLLLSFPLFFPFLIYFISNKNFQRHGFFHHTLHMLIEDNG
jgi:hypothetical protein